MDSCRQNHIRKGDIEKDKRHNKFPAVNNVFKITSFFANHLFKIDNKSNNPLIFNTNTDGQWACCIPNVSHKI